MSDPGPAVETDTPFQGVEEGIEETKTPVKDAIARVAKRKAGLSTLTPVTPETKHGQGEAMVVSSRKRRKSASSTPHARSGSPLLKPALTERQQMALIMQMTDPHKQSQGGAGSGGEESVTTTPRSDTSLTPRSRIQRRNERGETLLHTAAIKGDVKTAATLIEQGAEVSATDNAGWTPLHEACNYGHVQMAELLLKHHADSHARGMDGDTPLHDAVINGHLKTVQLLLEYHSDPYQENDQGQSPIDVCKHPEILRLLREADASRDEGAREESEEEDVFIPKEKQVARVKSSRVKSGGSKSSSRSSGESLFEEEEDFARDKTKEPMFVEGASSGLTSEEAEREKSIGQTPKSRPRSALYSDLSSSESEGEHLEPSASTGGKSGIRKVRYHLAKVGEAKQKLLGKLEESGEADARSGGGQVAGVGGAKGHGENGESIEHTGANDKGVWSSPSPTRPQQSEIAADPPFSGAPDSISGPMAEPTMKTTDGQSDSPPKTPPTKSADSPGMKDEDLCDVPTGTLFQKPPEEKSPDDAVPHADSTLCEGISITPAVDTDDNGVTTPTHEEAVPVPSTDEEEEEEEEEVAPTRLLRSAVRRIGKSAGDKEEEEDEAEEEGLVVSLSLKLVKSRHSSFEEESRGKEDQDSDMDKLIPKFGDPSRKVDVSGGFLGKVDTDPLKLMAGKLAPERSDSTSSVDSRSSVISGGKGEGSRLGKHGRKSQQVFSSKVGPVERSNSTSSVDSHGSASKKEERGAGKHGRKPQQVFTFGRKESEGGEKGEGKGERADSLHISVDWGALPSTGKSSGSLSNTPTTAPTGGFTFPAKEAEAEGKEASPTLVSLPLLYSARATESSSDSTGPAFSMQADLQQPSGPGGSFGPVKPGPSTAALTVAALKKMRVEKEAARREKLREDTSPSRSNYLDYDPKVLPPKKRYRPIMRSAIIEQRRRRPVHVPTPAHINSFLMCTHNYRSKRNIRPRHPRYVYPPLYQGQYKLFSEQEMERFRLQVAHFTEQERLIITMEEEILRAHQRATKNHITISACGVLLENMLLQYKTQYDEKEKAAEGGGGEGASGSGPVGASSSSSSGPAGASSSGSGPAGASSSGSGPAGASSSGSGPAGASLSGSGPAEASSSGSGDAEASASGTGEASTTADLTKGIGSTGVEEGSLDCRLLAQLVQDVWDRFSETRFILTNRQKNEAECIWMLQRHYWERKRVELKIDPRLPIYPTHCPMTQPILFLPWSVDARNSLMKGPHYIQEEPDY